MPRRDGWMTVRVAICLGMMARAALAWGPAGHEIVTRLALGGCDDLPAWFREGGDALVALSNSLDRWKGVDAQVRELSARRADHYFDLDVWGDEPLPADRWAYVHRAAQRRIDPDAIGFLPFAVLEEYGVLLSAFRDVRSRRPGAEADALVAAGRLAHLVGDAAVPLHATRHHHGWVGPNPRGFTRRGEVHEWFESDVVAELGSRDLPLAPEVRRPLDDPTAAVRGAIATSLALVPRLYEAERARDRDPDAARALVRERLAAGAVLLARVWRTAWLRSAR